MAINPSTQYPWTQQQPQQPQQGTQPLAGQSFAAGPQAPPTAQAQPAASGVNSLATSATSAQLAEAGAQAGIDLALSQGPNLDLNSWSANERGQLLRSGFSSTQVDAYLQTATKAYQSTLQHEQSPPSTSGVASPSPQASYQALVQAVGQDVLPAGNNLEPQPLGGGATFSQNDADFASYGTQAGQNASASTNLNALVANNAQKLQQAGATPHQVAVYVASLQASYLAKNTQGTGSPSTAGS